MPRACYPNRSRETVNFVRPGGTDEALEIYDPGGRRVATLQPAGGAGAVT